MPEQMFGAFASSAVLRRGRKWGQTEDGTVRKRGALHCYADRKPQRPKVTLSMLEADPFWVVLLHGMLDKALPYRAGTEWGKAWRKLDFVSLAEVRSPLCFCCASSEGGQGSTLMLGFTLRQACLITEPIVGFAALDFVDFEELLSIFISDDEMPRALTLDL